MCAVQINVLGQSTGGEEKFEGWGIGIDESFLLMMDSRSLFSGSDSSLKCVSSLDCLKLLDQCEN